jgi:hypothetical protein
MLRSLMIGGLALVALSACGQSNNSDGYARGEASMASPPSPPPPPPMAAPAPEMAAMKVAADSMTRERTIDQEQQGGGGPQQNGQPPVDPNAARQIAYTYFYGFRVPTGNMEGLLNAHKAACEQAGVAKCYVVNSNISGLGEDSANGQLVIKGSREWIDSFKASMEDSLKKFGAELDSNNSSAEDLTVQILDTSARLNSTKTLRDRLQALLKDRPGRLSDLLDIERELARVQAEIDSTESILAAMKLRVSMSTLTLNYQAKYSAVSESIWRPLGDAFSGFLPNVVASLAGIVEFISSVLLWLVLGGAVIWLVLWRWRRGRAKKRAMAASETPKTA